LALPVAGTTASSATVEGWAIRICAVLIAGGVFGGALVRPHGRWREVAVGGFALGGLVAVIVFDVWFNAHATPPDCTSSNPCDTSYGLGAAFAAIPAAVLVVIGGFVGRAARRRFSWSSNR
jgi:hypothetical protein